MDTTVLVTSLVVGKWKARTRHRLDTSLAIRITTLVWQTFASTEEPAKAWSLGSWAI
jgi:hypothetical protein